MTWHDAVLPDLPPGWWLALPTGSRHAEIAFTSPWPFLARGLTVENLGPQDGVVVTFSLAGRVYVRASIGPWWEREEDRAVWTFPIRDRDGVPIQENESVKLELDVAARPYERAARVWLRGVRRKVR